MESRLYEIEDVINQGYNIKYSELLINYMNRR